MNVPAVLAGLYPPAVRRRWGADIAEEVRSAGPRTWFDTVLGAAKLWLRPSDWPDPVPSRTSRVLLTAFAGVLTVSVLLVRAGGPLPWRGPVTGLWLAPLLAGVVLSVPRPVFDRKVLRRMVTVGRGALVRAALAMAALVLLAHSGLGDHAPGALLVAYYWLTLGFTGFQLCLLVDRLGRLVVVPGLRRLRFALLCGGTGLALAAAQAGFGAPALACCLAVLAGVVVLVGRDLGRVRR